MASYANHLACVNWISFKCPRFLTTRSGYVRAAEDFCWLRMNSKLFVVHNRKDLAVVNGLTQIVSLVGEAHMLAFVWFPSDNITSTFCRKLSEKAKTEQKKFISHMQTPWLRLLSRYELLHGWRNTAAFWLKMGKLFYEACGVENLKIKPIISESSEKVVSESTEVDPRILQIELLFEITFAGKRNVIIPLIRTPWRSKRFTRNFSSPHASLALASLTEHS